MIFGFWNKRVLLYRWQKAQTLMSKGAFCDAIKVLETLQMPDGPKQIVILQHANALYHEGEHQKALEKYTQARKEELKWGGRQNKANSEYIIAYAELYAKIQKRIMQSKQKVPFDWVVPEIKKLSMIPASKRLKESYLPLPAMPPPAGAQPAKTRGPAPSQRQML